MQTSEVRISSRTDNKLANKQQLSLTNPWALFIVLIVIYTAVEFWVLAVTNFLFAKFHDGKMPTWQWLGAYGAIFTVGVILLTKTKILNVPIVAIENTLSWTGFDDK